MGCQYIQDGGVYNFVLLYNDFSKWHREIYRRKLMYSDHTNDLNEPAHPLLGFLDGGLLWDLKEKNFFVLGLVDHFCPHCQNKFFTSSEDNDRFSKPSFGNHKRDNPVCPFCGKKIFSFSAIDRIRDFLSGKAGHLWKKY